MVRLYLLLIVIVVAVNLSPAAAEAATAGNCGIGGAIVGCPNVEGNVGGGSVVLTGDDTSSGRAGTTGNSSTVGNSGAAGSSGSAGNSGTILANGLAPGWSPCYMTIPRCPTSGPDTPATGTSSATDPIPTITLSDIATFIPTPGRQQMEPDGWTIAGLDTNFYAITSQHVVNGTLLGRPADVRFTPARYLWAYGDGTSATKATMGTTWAAQGIAEFEPTPTSHVYEELGDYTITLSIVFTAEYRFAGGPWRPVVGAITLPVNDLHIRAGTAKTVLVEHDCVQNPAGPGC